MSMHTPPEPQRLEADLDSYIRALVNQRNNALDMVAQMEGVIGALRKEIDALKNPNVPKPLHVVPNDTEGASA